MSPRKIAIGMILFFFSFALACIVTPLPVPPTVDPEVDPTLITLEDSEGGVVITGAEGAIEPGGSEIRVTASIPVDSTPEPLTFQEIVTGEDGTFSVFLGEVESMGIFYIEFLTDEGDLFVMAITAQDGNGSIETDSGPHFDDDGSPDTIDCAAEDDSYRGRECP